MLAATTGTCLRTAAMVFAFGVFITSPSPQMLANFLVLKAKLIDV